MLKLLLSALITLLKSQMGTALVDFLAASVTAAANTQLTGAEKKTQVLGAAETLGGSVTAQLKAASGGLVNLAIEALVAKLKLSGGAQ